MAKKIRVFKRNPWRKTAKGYEPNPGASKRTVCFVGTEQEARRICTEHNKDRPLEPPARYRWTFYEFETK
jgi:hypothetical protein